MESEPVKKFTKCSDCKFLAYDTFWRINGLLVCGDCAEDRKRLEPPTKKRRKKRKEELIKIPQEQSVGETRTDGLGKNDEHSGLPSGSMLLAPVQDSEDIRMKEGGLEKLEKLEKNEKLKSEKPEVQEERRPLIVRLKLEAKTITSPTALDETPSRKSSQQSSSSITSSSRKRSQQSTAPVLSPAATPSPRSTELANSSAPDDVPSRKTSRISLRETPKELSDDSPTPDPPTLDKYPTGNSCQDESTSMATDPPPSLTIETVPFTLENLYPQKATTPTVLRRDSATRNNSSSAFPSVFNKDESLDKLYGLCSNSDCKQGLYDKSKNRDKFDDILCYGCSMPSLSPVSSKIKSLEEATQLILENLEGRKSAEPRKKIESMKSPGLVDIPGLRKCSEPRMNSEPPKSPELTKSPESKKKSQSKRNPKTTRSPQSSEHTKLEKSVERLTKSLEILKRAEFTKSPEPEKSPELMKSSDLAKSPVLMKYPELQKSPCFETSPRLSKSPKFVKDPEPTKTPELTKSPEPTKRNELRKRPEPSQENENPSPVGSEESEPTPKLKKLLESSVEPKSSPSIKIGDSEESCASCKRPFLAIHPRRLCHPETHEIVCPSCYRNFEITRKFRIEQLQNPKFQNTIAELKSEFDMRKQTQGFPTNVPMENFRYGFQPLLYPFPGVPDTPPKRKKKDLVSYFNSSEFQQVLERFQKETEKRVKEDNEQKKGECRDLVEDGRPRCNNHFCRVLLNGSGFAHPVTRNVVCPPCYKYFKKRRSDRKEKPAYNEQICEESFRTWRHPTTNEKCCYMCFKNVMWHLGNYIKKSSSPGAPSQKPENPKIPQVPKTPVIMKSPIGAARPLFSTGRLLPFNNPNWRFTFPDFFKPYPGVQNLLMYLQKNGKFHISSNYGAPVLGQIGRPTSPPEVIVLNDESDSEETMEMRPVRQEKVRKSLSFRIADLIDLKDPPVEKAKVPTVQPVQKTNHGKMCFTPNCKAVLTPSRQFYLHGTKNWICCACYRAYLENELKKVAEVEKMEKEQNSVTSNNDNENEFIDVEAIEDTERDSLKLQESPMPSCSDAVSPELPEKDGEDDNESIEDFSDEDSDLLESMDNVGVDDDSASEGVAEVNTETAGRRETETGNSVTVSLTEIASDDKVLGEADETKVGLEGTAVEDSLGKVDTEPSETITRICEETEKYVENIDDVEMKAAGNSDGSVLNSEPSGSSEVATGITMGTKENDEKNHEKSNEKLGEIKGERPGVENSVQNCKETHQEPVAEDQSLEETEDFSDDDLGWLDQDYDDVGHDSLAEVTLAAENHEQSGNIGLEIIEAATPGNIQLKPADKNQNDQEAKESMPGTPCSDFSDEDLDWLDQDYDDQDHDKISLEAEIYDEGTPTSKQPTASEKPSFGDFAETGSNCSDDSIPVIEDYSFSDFDDEDPDNFINNYHDPMDVPESQDARISANEAAFENAMEAEYDEHGYRNPLSPVFANNDVPVENEDRSIDSKENSEDSSSSSSSDDDDDDSSSSEDSEYEP
ncbi:hypothetical protein CAEBREN_13336 [Caenorhabditis brenneri]|uniref:Uncharacterized protein n=1 Tax=Caenorhabditis brenneri TaxID=135651 RepID=G0N342_CAEBE|nr:hypothetical protein CAEBREN_13336 [Caenorhabditis brenneri]